MTHQKEHTGIELALEEIISNGVEGLESAVSLLINEAMKVERSRSLKAEPWERSKERLGYANGYKPRSLNTRIGKLSLQVPKVRDGISFFPKALDRGVLYVFKRFWTNQVKKQERVSGSNYLL